MRRLVLALSLLAYSGASRLVAAPTAEPPLPPNDPRIATRRTAHEALVEHCGKCHEAHRSSSPRALAVFDLDQPDWPNRFDDRLYPGALRRLAQRSEAARAAFVAFHDAERAAAPSRRFTTR